MKPLHIFIPLLLASNPLQAGSPQQPVSEANTWHCADHHHDDTPFGVMGGHTHHKGEWMLSYRYMFMAMEENRDGTRSVSDASVLNDFVVTPTDMDMEMHMFGIMYAPTDRLTLMGMVNLVELSMNHEIGRGPLVGTTFKTESSGIGDSSLTALYRFWDSHKQRAHFGLGLLLPTAEIDEEDYLPPAGGDGRLPYPMQLGSGSWGIAPSLTYLAQYDEWSWGAQVSGKFYLDDNDEGYRLGNRGELTTWGVRHISETISLSLRATASTWGNIHGQDSQIPITNPMGVPIVPTADPDRRGGSKVDLSFGVNVLLPIEGARLGLEVGRPLWQDLDGPQLASDWWFLGGLRYAF